MLCVLLSYFQKESYIPQLFTRNLSPREPKSLSGVVDSDWDGQYLQEKYLEILGQ